MLHLIASAVAAPPSVSVLPYAEDGPRYELRASVFGPEAFVDGKLEPDFSGGLGGIWRTGRLRVESTVWRPLARNGETTGVTTVQLKVVRNDTLTIAPWVSGTLRIHDAPCKARCSDWSDLERRGPEYWGGWGVTLRLDSKPFSWTLVAPATIDRDAFRYGQGPSVMIFGSILVQHVAMDWRLNAHFAHPEGQFNTLRLSVRNPLPPDFLDEVFYDRVPQYDLQSGGADLAWRHERGALFAEGRASYLWSGPSLGLTVGWTP